MKWQPICEPPVRAGLNIGTSIDAEYQFDTLDTPAVVRSFAQLRLCAPPARPPANRGHDFLCGAGRVSCITSNCAVWRDRGLLADGLSLTFSVVAQIDGDPSYIGQSSRRCQLSTGALCLVDGDQSFQIEPSGSGYTHLVLSLPRERVLQRFPDLRTATALLLDASEPGTVLYRQIMVEALRQIGVLDVERRRSTLDALLRLLGVLKLPTTPASAGAIEPAQRFIEDSLHDPRLSAESVARSVGITRRRLDERFVRACGMPVAAHILERRMAEAATSLADADQRRRSVWDIAAALGYTDAAHFSRAFKRRHGMTASAWRASAATRVSARFPTPSLPE